MKVLAINNLVKRDLLVYYRREFSASALIEFPGRSPMEKNVSFSLEHAPTGETHVKASFLDDIDYPLVPAMRHLQSYILDMEKKGLLP